MNNKMSQILVAVWIATFPVQAVFPLEFSLAPSYSSGNSAYGILAGDINRDGRPDVVAINRNEGNVSVFQGKGFGMLAAASNYYTGEWPMSGALGDMNGDGWPDIIVANYGGWSRTGSMSVLLNRGDGTFYPRVEYEVEAYPPSVALGDVNEDGKLDAVVSCHGNYLWPGVVCVFIGRGDGTFLERTNYLAGAIPEQVRLVDVNGDHHLDIVTVSRESKNVNVLLGRGDGKFAPAVSSAAGGGSELVVGDFNEDGHPDVITIGPDSFDISLLLGTGRADFLPRLVISVPGPPYTLLTRDFDGDGHLDLAVNDDDDIYIMKGNGDGSFAFIYTLDMSGDPVQMDAADFTGDGHDDLVVANGSVYLYEGDGQCRFFGSKTGYLLPKAVLVGTQGDFNGDGHLDLATGNKDGYEFPVTNLSVSFLLGKGNGMFVNPINYPVKAVLGIHASDLNGDGSSELVVVGSNICTVFAQITNEPYAKMEIEIPQGAAAVASGDFNQDGYMDLAIIHEFEGWDGLLTVWLGSASGAFKACVTNTIAYTPSTLRVADYNHDGHQDLLVGYRVQTFFSVILGKGNGTFGSPVDYASESYHVLATGDFNGDGNDDVVTAWYDADEVVVHCGRADGTFGPAQRIYLGGAVNSAVTADFNSDNYADLALGCYSQVRLMASDGFLPATNTVFTHHGIVFAAGDYNEDGRPDLAVADGLNVLVIPNRTQPCLEPVLLPDQRIRFAWPNWIGYRLEESTNLFLTSKPVSIPVVTNGHQKVLTNTVTQPSALYRLIRE